MYNMEDNPQQKFLFQALFLSVFYNFIFLGNIQRGHQRQPLMRERLTEKHEGIDYRINLVALPPLLGFPHSSVRKESACNAGDTGVIPGSANSPGEGHSNPLQYSCLENPTDRGA